MANYLMPALDILPSLGGGSRAKKDLMVVHPMYKLKISNKSGSIKFDGYTPPNFSISLSSNWTPPYADMSLMDKAADLTGSSTLGRATSGVKFGGGSTINKLASAHMWTGPSYLVLDLPILLDAYTSTKKEVVEPLVQLLSLCAPSETVAGFLVPPGPSPAAAIVGEAMNQFGFGESSLLDDSESFTLEIGTFLRISPVIVMSATASFDNVWEDDSGNPLSVDFVLSLSSYFAVTREDLAKWFKSQPTGTA